MDPEKHKASRFRKLKYRSKYIELDLAETKEIYSEASKAWVKAILSYCEKNKVNSPLVQEDKVPKKEATEQESTIFSSTQIKDLNRKIAIATHPDKLITKPEEEKEHKSALFNKAITAKDDNDIDSMLAVALELEIDMSNLDMRCLDLLEKQLDEKEKKIKEMHQDIAWQWYYAGDFKRNFIISKICPKPDKEV